MHDAVDGRTTDDGRATALVSVVCGGRNAERETNNRSISFENIFNFNGICNFEMPRHERDRCAAIVSMRDVPYSFIYLVELVYFYFYSIRIHPWACLNILFYFALRNALN